MNCERCKTLLPPDARFCRVCGLPISTPAPGGMVVNPPPFNQPTINSSPTTPAPWQAPRSLPQPTQPTPPPVPPQQQRVSQQWGQPTQAAPPSYQSPMVLPPTVGTMQSAGGQAFAPARPRRGGGCLPKILITLVILVILVAGGWFIGLRPYLHSLAQNQIDQELSNSINQIIPVPPVINTFVVTETAINNLFVLNHAPSDPVQNMHLTITPGNLQLDFQAYGFSCSVSGILTASNGKPVVNNVAIQGVVGLIMSPDELTTILNNRLSDAQVRLHRSITSITLKEHEIDLTFGGVTI